MDQKKKDPEAVAAACRVGIIDGFGVTFDTPGNTHFPSKSPAALYLLRRFPITEQRAEIIAELSGLGRRIAS